MNVTLLIRSGEATLKQITRALKRDAATTLTLTAEEAPPNADDQIRRLVVGMVLVDAPQSCNTEAFGVTATAHVIDTQSRRVDLVLPFVKRTCF